MAASPRQSYIPLLYNETIVLNLGDQVVWLELTNYETVLLKDGVPGNVITLKVGLTDNTGKGVKILAQPSTTGNLFRIGIWMDVADVIKFQQSVLQYPTKTTLPAWTYTASYEYMVKVLTQAFADIGYTVSSLLTNKLSDSLLQTLKAFSQTHYRRSEWTFQKKAGASIPVWSYQGEIPGLLNPDSYAAYERLGFKGYFPDPTLVLQEERGQIIIPDTGQATTADSRTITPLRSKLVVKVNSEWKQTGADPLQPVFQKIDEGIQQQSAATQTASGNPPPATLHSELPRINCYGFRGDSRDPLKIFERGGFFANVTRKQEGYASQKQAELDKELSRDIQWNYESYIGTLIRLDVLHLGQYSKDEVFGGFVSTTKSVSIAKSFSGAWMAKAKNDAATFPKEQKASPLLYHSQNFCFATRCRGGFVLPSEKKTVKQLQAIHTFAYKAEQEVAVPGMIGWNEVVGFRMCCYQSTGPYLAGPVWLRASLPASDLLGFRGLYVLFSGKSQGKADNIEKVYPTSPWGSTDKLPTRAEVK